MAIAISAYHEMIGPDSIPVREGFAPHKLRSANTPEPATGPTDLQLLARIALREQSALNLLYHRYAQRLGRFLRRFLRDEEIVSEAINDTFLVIWRKAGEFDASRSSVSTWCFGIAYRAALKARGRYSRNRAEIQSLDPEIDYEIADDNAGPESTLYGWQLSEKLSAALARLSPAHRAVIELTFVEGFSYQKIAEILGCPENTVKTRVFHARRRVAELLAHLV
jgi:RNA polymerase sigma-70 factor (ECF subfamily)